MDDRDILDSMKALAADGWCVVLKVLPPGFPWIVEGSRSEYDAPCPDTGIAPDKWCCEAQDVHPTAPYRRQQWACHADPFEALRIVVEECRTETELQHKRQKAAK